MSERNRQSSAPKLEPHMANPPAHVFLSYASADRERALEIAEALQAAGIRTWIDRTGISGGSAWAETIAAAVRSRSVLAVLCSQQSVASRNVRQELQLAWDHGKPIVPLLMEPMTFPDGVAFFLQGTQWLELFDGSREVWLPKVVATMEQFGAPSVDVAADSVISTSVASEVRRDGSLPISPNVLIGRDEEVARIAERFRHDVDGTRRRRQDESRPGRGCGAANDIPGWGLVRRPFPARRPCPGVVRDRRRPGGAGGGGRAIE
jgi:hypothetical protein